MAALPPHPNTAVDVLRLPLVGRLLRWRWGRLAMQSLLLVLALAMLYDGFTGPQQAARNLATVGAWVHYRGLVVIALLLVGNLFCMGCPFTLPRTLGKRFSLPGRRFPRALRSKWLAIASLFALFFVYEWLDLWASPALTAWVIVFYFVASFALEALFQESAFCKYVCPLGTFNFLYATAAPTQIGVRDASVCAACTGKECVNGSYAPQTVIHIDTIPTLGGQPRDVSVTHAPQGTPGCGTLLYPPQMASNLDCTLCLDCVRACPHDNASLFVRAPGRELAADAWPRRWDVSFLAVALAFIAITNAFAMVPPMIDLQQGIGGALGLPLNAATEPLILLLMFGLGNVLLPGALLLGAAYASQRAARTALRLREVAAVFAPAFVPLGFGIWAAHYSFHFLVAPLSIVPVAQEFLGLRGDWQAFSGSVDMGVIGVVQALALLGGFGASLWIAQRRSQRTFGRRGFPAVLPWALLLLALMWAAFGIFALPMEMRGSLMG
jgi:polyferredoxin